MEAPFGIDVVETNVSATDGLHQLFAIVVFPENAIPHRMNKRFISLDRRSAHPRIVARRVRILGNCLNQIG